MNEKTIAKNSFLVLLVAAFILAGTSSGALAAHTTDVSIAPDLANCGEISNTYTVTVMNTGDTDNIREVRIYDDSVNDGYTDPGIVDFDCGPAPTGWTLDDRTELYHYCQYETSIIDIYMIEPGETETFTFTATLDDTNQICGNQFKVATIDDKSPIGEVVFKYPFVSVDCADPVLEKSLSGGNYYGVCPPELQGPGEECWIQQETCINFEAYDNLDECDQGLDYCEYTYTVDGVDHVGVVQVDPIDGVASEHICFDEDSVHILDITCYDIAGNMINDVETFRVDSTEPETTKELGDPKKIDGYVEWITTQTPITITPVDPDPTGFSCNSGLDKTWYRNDLASQIFGIDMVDDGFLTDDICYHPEDYCNEQLKVPTPYDTEGWPGCIDYVQEWCAEDDSYNGFPTWEDCVENFVHMSPGEFFDTVDTPVEIIKFPPACEVDDAWKLYRGVPITKDEESCHVLQFFSVDNLGNVEDTNYNCFFVDDTPPEVFKDNGDAILDGEEPAFTNEGNPEGEFHWITTKMPIEFDCVDPEPHPSGDEKVCFKVSYDYTEIEPDVYGWGYNTESYCDTALEDGYCCVDVSDEAKYNFYFKEESMHNLEYYCIDAVGKQSNEHIQYYKVDDTPPTLTKVLNEPYYGLCPPASGYVPLGGDDECFVDTATSITVTTEDGGEICAVDGVDCEWRYRVWDVLPVVATVDFTSPIWSKWNSTFPIKFPEESYHEIEIVCEDDLGNSVSDVEWFSVDKTPPETTKTYVGPQYSSPVAEYPKWVSLETAVVLDATDSIGPHDSGVYETYYREFLVDDDACWNQELCMPLQWEGGEPAWNVYDGEFYFGEESCHQIEYYSVDNVGKTENIKRQCVFVDDTPPITTKTIGEPKVEGRTYNVTETVCTGPPEVIYQPTGTAEDRSDYYNEYTGTDLVESAIVTPCDLATVGTQCAYVDAESLPSYAEATLVAEGADVTGCGNVLILSSGDPLNDGSTISTSMGNPGCGTNPDGYDTYDCVQLIDYSPAEDMLVLAVSSEWAEYLGSVYTDWMQVAGIVDVSINGWGTANVIPYGPLDSGTKTLATISSGSTVDLRVADSGDGIYDTALIVVPLSCFEFAPEPLICGDGTIDAGEECDDGNNDNGDGCSSVCLVEDGPVDCVEVTHEMPVTYITQDTEITLTCEDIEPHPVNHVSLWYRYRLSEDCVNWGEWTEWIDPKEEESVEKIFQFPEDSCHELEWYCDDILENTGPVYSEYDIVDTVAPVITTEIVGPNFGDCPAVEEGDICYLDGVTEIHVDANDPEPHPVDNVVCEWYYVLDGDLVYHLDSEGVRQEGVSGEVSAPFVINFPEETTHELVVTCWDALGNTNTIDEVYHVDKTPPEIHKKYGEPYYSTFTQVEGIGEYWAEWITSDTSIHIDIEDAGPHKSGIHDVKYRYTRVNDEYCRYYVDGIKTEGEPYVDMYNCKDAVGEGEWTVVESDNFDFTIDEDSCHLIEIIATDNVEKTNDHKQCVFVDNLGPNPDKKVGEPKEMWDGADAYYYDIADKCWTDEYGEKLLDIDQCREDPNCLECWRTTRLTPMYLECDDQNPHPVGNDGVCFNVNWDGDDVTEGYCEGGVVGDDDFCCVDHETTLYFDETSEHELEYYCVDKLGNVGTLDIEKFKVEDTAFNITLNKKWNLISVPVFLLDENPNEVFKHIEDKIKGVWTYDPTLELCGELWCSWFPGVAGDSLENIRPGWGYWILMDDDAVLTIGGSEMKPGPTGLASREIVPGWNLIGYYGAEGLTEYNGPDLYGNGKPAYCGLYSLGQDIWDKSLTGLVTYWEPENPNQWFTLDNLDYMNPGAGYWLATPQDGIYTVSTSCGIADLFGGIEP